MYYVVAINGPDALYTGKTAASLAGEIQDAGGILTVEDLQSARAELKEPIRGEAFGFEFIIPPPPSSAITIFSALKVLEGFKIPLAGSSFLGIHRQVEALKHAFALRMHLGDPGQRGAGWKIENYDEIMKDMISPEFADHLRSVT